MCNYYKGEVITASICGESHTFTVYFREHFNDNGSGYIQGYIVHRSPEGAEIVYSRYAVYEELDGFYNVRTAMSRRLRDIKRLITATGNKWYA